MPSVPFRRTPCPPRRRRQKAREVRARRRAAQRGQLSLQWRIALSVMLPRQHSPLCMCCHCNPNGTFERARTTTGKKGFTMRFRLRCWSWVHVSKIRKEMPRDRLTRERATGTISFHVLTDAVCGRVAQLVEQRTENPRAEGSSPPPTTTMMTVPRILAIRALFGVRLKNEHLCSAVQRGGYAVWVSSSTRPRIFLTVRPSMPPSLGRFLGPKMTSTTTRIRISSAVPCRIFSLSAPFAVWLADASASIAALIL